MNVIAFRRFSARFAEIATSPACTFAWFALASVFLLTEQYVFGSVAMTCALIVLFVFSDDLQAALTPFMCICTLLLPCYDGYGTFIGFWWLGIPFVGALVFHFLWYRRPYRIDEPFFGCAAVAVAVSVAGLGTGTSYSGSVIFYTLFLGVVMVVAHLCLTAEYSTSRTYDGVARFFYSMAATGLLCFVMLAKLWFVQLAFPETVGELHFQPGNNLATVLLLVMPFYLYGILEARGKLRVLSAVAYVLSCVGMILTKSRAAWVLLPVMLLITAVFLALSYKPLRIPMTATATGIALAGGGFVLWFVLTGNLNVVQNIYSANQESRWLLIKASVADFLQSPVVGVGIAGSRHTAAYSPLAGAMSWYHMMVPQVLGSMGSVGVLAYGYQVFTRARTYLHRITPRTTVMFLSYLGLFLMTQVNPGEFCPLPYELVAVLLFVLMRREVQDRV